MLGAGTTFRAGLFVEVITRVVLASTTSVWAAGATLTLFRFPRHRVGDGKRVAPPGTLPENLMGRVNGIYLRFEAGSISVGSLLGGLIAGASASRRLCGWRRPQSGLGWY